MRAGRRRNVFLGLLFFAASVSCLTSFGAEDKSVADSREIAMQNVAHRGMWDESVPENTAEAVKRAYDEGATWVEVDFFYTKHDQVVCTHGVGPIKNYPKRPKRATDLTPEDIAAINLAPKNSGKVFRMPLLADVLSVVPKHCVLQAEIKGYSPRYADVFDAAVKSASLSETNIVVSSFYYDALKDFKSRYPKYRTIWLHALSRKDKFDVNEIIAKCKAAKFDCFCPAAFRLDRGVTPAHADAIRNAGIEFRLFGVNNIKNLKLAKKYGATGFTCNHWHKAFDWAKQIGGIRLVK